MQEALVATGVTEDVLPERVPTTHEEAVETLFKNCQLAVEGLLDGGMGDDVDRFWVQRELRIMEDQLQREDRTVSAELEDHIRRFLCKAWVLLRNPS